MVLKHVAPRGFKPPSVSETRVSTDFPGHSAGYVRAGRATSRALNHT
jgi:hypothetical protein